MNRCVFCAALTCSIFIAACSNMGAGDDPLQTEAAISLMLPALISKDDGEIAPNVEALESPEIAAADEAESGEAAKIDEAESLAEDALNAEEALEGQVAEDSGEAPLQESKAAAEAFAVSSWHVAMVSAAGFQLQEVVEPSEEPALFAVQAGRWKITLLAKDETGSTIATSEVKGLSISAGEERSVSFSLEWPSPEENVEES